ncbi:MAG: polysaccharide deacetylase family protein [Hyphomicrobiaceae bacterium]|nr:polysaccharide deacetylase family protein [Hyphomicrobiaceae bacterium]
MRYRVASFSMCALAFLSVHPATASECVYGGNVLGVSRVLHVDTSDGPQFGTLQYEQTLDLEPNEVVLTFDDGPHPYTTQRVLEALAKECVKATFFPVGAHAERHPEILQSIADEGHTIGAHTWSHRNIRRLSKAHAAKQIERGFRAVSAAVDIQIAPFFRFPGLNDSKAMSTYAGRQGYAVFSIDVNSDDWRGIGPRTIIRRTMARLKRQKGGIILFHDTKYATAAALPAFLKLLKRDGYRIVHIVPKQTYDSLLSAKAGRPEAATLADLAGPGKPESNNKVRTVQR